MNMQNLENDTLQAATRALKEQTGMALTEVQGWPSQPGAGYDAVLETEDGDRLYVEVKLPAAQVNMGKLINQIREMPGKPILIADYINPNLAERLREQKIQFLDEAGNAYINLARRYIYIKGCKRLPRREQPGYARREKTGRAFQATGLKMLFAILCQPELLNAPYRTIAKVAGIANGTVGWVINDLKAGGLLVETNNKGRTITNYKKLFDLWVDAYPITLRPKLQRGQYIVEDPHWWGDFAIEQYQACWGGEIAAALLTEYLRPEIGTVYVNKQAFKSLMAAAKLRKPRTEQEYLTHRVDIYDAFWQHEDWLGNDIAYPHREKIVNPMIIYADLIATGDIRNAETARMIYEQHLPRYLRQD